MYILKSIAFYNKLNLWILILLYIPFKGAGQSLQTHSKGLKDVYQSYFTMGVAASVLSLQGEEAQLIKKEFASITPENAMKMGPIHPEENRYYWKDADSIVSFAQRNGLKVRGHALCWHEQTPAWLFKDSKGNRVSKEVLLSRLRSHIFTVMQRYKGKVYAWDVVNEAIDDHPDTYLRNSLWYQICGEDFITKAFEYAHEADPDALLFYNDYNTERPEKVERICRLIKSLKDKNVPIYGIGLQAHWSIFEPSTAELENAIRKYAALGLKIQITELDISVYPWEKEKRALRPGESDAYTPALEKQQINKYKEVFQVLRAHRKEITGITFWNISDRHSWLDEYPVQGRKNYPLLFDQQLKRKKAYFAITKF